MDPDACPHCWGNRTIWEQCEDGSWLPTVCPTCNATGKRPHETEEEKPA